MLPPIRATVRLSSGTVTLRAWGAHVADAYLTDLLTLTATLGLMREQWHDYRRGDMEPQVWAAYWRLVHASLDDCTLPDRLTWNDRLDLLQALMNLNDLELAEGKLNALVSRAARSLERRQARAAPATTWSSSGPLA